MIATKENQKVVAITEEQKDEARARILARLKTQANRTVQANSWTELRKLLKLEDISMGLFKASLWHLNAGDRDAERKPRIKVSRPGNLDNWRSQDGRIVVTVLR